MEKTRWIRFSGAPGGTFPATWGQREFWHTINKLRPSGYYQIPWAVPIPATCSLDRVEQLLTDLATRYEALRTTLRRDPDGELRQIVHGEGAIPVWTTELPPDRSAIAASRPLNDFLETEPAVDREFPWKIVVLTWKGAPHHLVCVCSHMVLDGQSGEVLAAEVHGALTSPVDDGDASPVRPVRQPSEVARWEAEASNRRISQKALDHWRSVLDNAPPGPFPSAAPKGSSPLWRGVLRSEAADAAERAVIGRTGLSSSAVFLSMSAALLSQLTGNGRFLFRVPTSNRFSPDLQRYVGALSQHAVLTVDARAGTFDELMRSVAGDLLRAQTRARYDADLLHDMLDELRTVRAGQPDLTLLFNDIKPIQQVPRGRTAMGNPAADLGAADVTWELLHTANQDITFYVRIANAGGILSLEVAADTSCLSKPEIERFLHATERLLTHAGRGDFALSDTPRVSGL